MLASEAHRIANRARFARLIARPDPDIDLALGALCIAADGRRELEFAPTLESLEALAGRVRIRLDRGDDDSAAIAVLHAVLYREAGFRGAGGHDFHDRRNSLIDQVIARRVGLPISLAIVELEVGWRLGLPLHGVGMPGHFLVGAPHGAVFDPADRGRRLTPADCQSLLREALGDRILFHSGMVRPAGRREILARVLRNLRSVLLAERDWPAALGIVEMLAVVEPVEPDHDRDRGLLLGRMGRFTDALALLERYLDARPDGHDAADVKQVVGIFRGRRN